MPARPTGTWRAARRSVRWCWSPNLDAMADDLKVTHTFVVPGSELSERFSRSSGPGGQGVNTADSRVELSFDLAKSRSVPDWLRHRMLCQLRGRLVNGVLVVAASEHRAQLQNRAAARDRMA